MRRQDEIVALYQTADEPFRRLLLDLASDLTPAFDGRVVGLLVRSAMAAADPALAALGQSARRTFEPALGAATHRIAAPMAGTWSALHRAPGGPGAAMDAPDEAEQARQATLHRALLFALEPVRKALCAAAGEPVDPHHARVLAALAEMPAPEAVDALAARLKDANAASVAVALAIAGTAAGREAVLAAVAQGAPGPAVAALRHVADLEDPRTASRDARLVDALLTAAREPATPVASAAACALAGHPGLIAEAAPLLLRRNDPWVTGHLLVALARAKTGLEHVLAVGRGSRVGLVRALAVRAAGAIGTAEARAFLLEVATGGQGAAQALALELAAREPDGLDDATLVGLTRNPHWRVRLNAALALAARDPQPAFQPLMDLLSSELELERVGGVFALAYLSGDSAERVLFHLAGDASVRVREAAVASLSRHPTPRAHNALLKIALGGDTPLACRALEALAWTSGEGAAGVLSRLLDARAFSADPAWRGQLYRTAGALAASLMLKPAALAAGLESAVPEEVAGCLDGLMLAGIGPGDSAAVPAAALSDPRIAARAALRAIAGGRLAEAEPLAQLVSNPASRGPAIDATLELLDLAPWLGRTPRNAELQNELAKALHNPGYQRFATRRLELSKLRASLPVPGEADAEIAPSRVRELPAAAAALVDLPRPRPRIDTSGPGYYPPPMRPAAPWWRPVAVAAGALALLIGGAVLWARNRPTAVANLAPAPSHASPAPVRLTIPGLAPLAEGGRVEAKPGQRLAIAGPYPGPKVDLEGGALTLEKARSRAGGRLGCDLAFTLTGGSLDVDGRPGATRVEVDAAGQRLSGTGALFRVTVGPAGGRVTVRAGTVELSGATPRTVAAGTEATWGTPPDPR